MVILALQSATPVYARGQLNGDMKDFFPLMAVYAGLVR
jgi:hypothetical protein